MASLAVTNYEDIARTVAALEPAAVADFAAENLTSFFVFEQENKGNLGPDDATPAPEARILLGAIDEALGLDSSGLTLDGDEALVVDDAFITYRDALVQALDESGFDLDGFLSGGGTEPLSAASASLETGQAALEPLFGIDAISLIDELINLGLAFIPPDPIAAAGTDRLVNVVNTAVEIFTKDGELLDQFALDTLFGSPTDTFDPKVVYDQFNDRFVIVTLEAIGIGDDVPDPTNDVSNIYLAVSKDGSPSSVDDFDTITIDALTTGFLTTGEESPLWADFPGFSVSDDAIYITNNRFAVDGPGFGTPGLWIVEKGDGTGGFYDGGEANVLFTDPVIEAGLPPSLASTIQPSLNFGELPEGLDNFLYANGFTFGAGVPGAPEAAIVYSVSEPFAEGGPTFTASIVTYPDVDLFDSVLPDAPQLDFDVTGIDTNDRRSLDVVFRDGLLYAAFTQLPFEGENAGQATAFYSVTDPLNEFALVDFVEIGGEDIAPGTFTFFPSLAVNGNGDVAVTFSASGPNVLAGSYFTGRAATDAPGTVRESTVIAAGEAPYELIDGAGRNRWGDYTGAVVDPVDDSFWLYNLNAAVFPGFIPVWDTAYANVDFGEIVEGTDGDDVLIGGPLGDFISGGPGDDDLSGLEGNDALDGGDGADVLDGGPGADSLADGPGDDVASGEEGDDLFVSGPGDDVLLGGDGIDTVDLSASTDSVFIALDADGFGDAGFIETPGLGTDFIVSIENAIGGAGGDLILGSAADNALAGGDGDDTLNGRAGDDLLIGEAGSDVFVLDREFGNDVLGLDSDDTVDIRASLTDAGALRDALVDGALDGTDAIVETGADGSLTVSVGGNSFTTFAPAAEQIDVTPIVDPVSYWPADEDDDVLADIAGGFDATLDGAMVSADGLAGAGLVFDGTDDFATVEHDAGFALDSGAFSVWFKSDVPFGKTQAIVSKDAAFFLDGGHLNLQVDPDNRVSVRLQSTEADFTVTGGFAATGHWNHAVVNFGADTGLELYVNGTLVGSDAFTGGIGGNTEDWVFGASGKELGFLPDSGLIDHFDGAIDEFVLFDRGLSAGEVGVLYDEGLAGETLVLDGDTLDFV